MGLRASGPRVEWTIGAQHARGESYSALGAFEIQTALAACHATTEAPAGESRGVQAQIRLGVDGRVLSAVARPLESSDVLYADCVEQTRQRTRWRFAPTDRQLDIAVCTRAQ